MRPRVSCALLMLLATVSGGCQMSASGRAIETRLGAAFRRLSEAPSRLFADEARRGRSLILAIDPRRFLHASELTTLVAGIQRSGARTLSSIKALPRTLRGPTSPLLQRVSTDLRRLVGDEQSGLRRRDRVGMFLRQIRAALRKVPQVLQLDKAILPGPGDLDRTDDPHQVGRSLTWVERLLRRF